MQSMTIAVVATALVAVASASAQKPAETPGASRDAVTRGRQVYTKVGCYQCHGREGQGGSAGSRLGPNPWALDMFTKYVRQPRGEMPPYSPKILSDSDLADMHAFLRSLPPPPKLPAS